MANTPGYKIVAKTRLGEIAEKKTRDCFSDGNCVAPHDYDFDVYLPTVQPGTAPCFISTLDIQLQGSFLDAVGEVLGSPAARTDVRFLGACLKRLGYLMTLPQGEAIMKAVRSGKDVKLAEGRQNIFLTETNDPENPVTVVCFGNEHGKCCAHLFDIRTNPCLREDARMFMRNFV